MEIILSLLVGIGLSAACGFRVFVPLLVVSIASHAGHLTLAPGFAWMGSDAALVAFAVATVLEIAAYYVPWLDNLLDTMATPAAIVAGTIVTASVVTGMSPLLKWTLAVIAGGGAAGLVQGTTILTRGASSLGTGGLANPILATAELGGSIVTSVVSLFWPILALILIVAILFFAGWRLLRKRSRPAAA
jgi:Domain of unknown function (DUF4126)